MLKLEVKLQRSVEMISVCVAECEDLPAVSACFQSPGENICNWHE
jgi:hypothetical protein